MELYSWYTSVFEGEGDRWISLPCFSNSGVFFLGRGGGFDRSTKEGKHDRNAERMIDVKMCET
jgi:hypothetical protein